MPGCRMWQRASQTPNQADSGRQRRGRGYASWVVASLTQQLLDAGARPCLYTDQANPVSNLVYERIGYEPVHDEGNVVVRGI